MIVYLALGWAVGIALVALVVLPGGVWLAVGGVGLAGMVWRWRELPQRNLLAVVLALGLGAGRAAIAEPRFDDTSLPSYLGAEQVFIEGVVVAAPDVRDQYQNLTVQVTWARVPVGDGQTRELVAPGYGVVQVRAGRFVDVFYGSRVALSGPLTLPPADDDFNYGDYLARQGVYGLVDADQLDVLGRARCPNDLPGYGLGECIGFALQGWLAAQRGQMLAVLTRIFPEPQAALISGMLLGEDQGIPNWLQAAFRATGTTHIVAISGFNIALVAGLVLKVFGGWLPERYARWPAVLAVTVYTLLAGADGSVVRAAVMATLVLLSGGLARGGYRNGVYAVSTGVILITAVNPGWLWDVGFQLSVVATLGLIVYATPFSRAAEGWLARWLGNETARQFGRGLAEYTTVTLAAQVTTLPLIVFYFHELSLISLVANLVVLPVQPLLFGLGALALLAGLVWLPLGQAVALLDWPLLAYTIEGVRLLAGLPGAVLPLPRLPWGWLVLAYGGLGAVSWVLSRPAGQRPAWWRRLAQGWLPNVALGGLVLVTVVVWQAALAAPDGQLQVRYLNVGDGQATFIRTPNGNTVLIDGGPSPARLVDGLGQLLPAQRRVLDLVVLTDASDAHAGGLVGLTRRYTVRQALILAEPDRTWAYTRWVEELTAAGVPVSAPGLGETVQLALDEGVTLSVLSLGSERTVLEVAYGRSRFVFAPNLTTPRTVGLLEDVTFAPVSVLLAPGQGQAGTLSPALLSAVNPQAVVISVGAGNAEGAPAEDTLTRLAGYTVLRTDIHGWVRAESDGERLWLYAER